MLWRYNDGHLLYSFAKCRVKTNLVDLMRPNNKANIKLCSCKIFPVIIKHFSLYIGEPNETPNDVKGKPNSQPLIRNALVP